MSSSHKSQDPLAEKLPFDDTLSSGYLSRTSYLKLLLGLLLSYVSPKYTRLPFGGLLLHSKIILVCVRSMSLDKFIAAMQKSKMVRLSHCFWVRAFHSVQTKCSAQPPTARNRSMVSPLLGGSCGLRHVWFVADWFCCTHETRIHVAGLTTTQNTRAKISYGEVSL